MASCVSDVLPKMLYIIRMPDDLGADPAATRLHRRLTFALRLVVPFFVRCLFMSTRSLCVATCFRILWMRGLPLRLFDSLRLPPWTVRVVHVLH